MELLEDSKDPDPVRSVRGLVYAGVVKNAKGGTKRAVLEALAIRPDLTSDEIARDVRCSARYVQSIRKEITQDDRQYTGNRVPT